LSRRQQEKAAAAGGFLSLSTWRASLDLKPRLSFWEQNAAENNHSRCYLPWNGIFSDVMIAEINGKNRGL
jgi:hypothetical protein